MQELKMLGDRVLIQPAPDAQFYDSGQLLKRADQAKEKPNEGTVIAVGLGAISELGTLIPTNVHVGDRVLYGHFSGSEIKLNGIEYRIMLERELYAVVTGEPEVEQVESSADRLKRLQEVAGEDTLLDKIAAPVEGGTGDDKYMGFSRDRFQAEKLTGEFIDQSPDDGATKADESQPTTGPVTQADGAGEPEATKQCDADVYLEGQVHNGRCRLAEGHDGAHAVGPF